MPKTHRQETYKKEQMNKVPSAIITIHLSLMRLPSVSRLHPPQRCDRSRLLITRSRCEINPELQHLLAASSYLSNKHIKLTARKKMLFFAVLILWIQCLETLHAAVNASFQQSDSEELHQTVL